MSKTPESASQDNPDLSPAIAGLLDQLVQRARYGEPHDLTADEVIIASLRARLKVPLNDKLLHARVSNRFVRTRPGRDQ